MRRPHSHRPRLRALLLPLLLPGCTYPTDEAVAPGPAAAFTVVSTSPGNGAAAIPLGAGLALVFSDFPDPTTLNPFGAVTIRSNQQSRDYKATVDLVARAVTVTPTAPLQPHVQYAVIASRSLASLAGVPLAAPFVTRFTTGDTPGGAPLPPTPRTLAADVQPILDARCLAGCHDAATRAQGLILDAAHAASALAATSPRAELPHVKPFDPARSYLLRKLLGTPDIQGDRMPPGAPLTDEELRTVSDWIAGGAG